MSQPARKLFIAAIETGDGARVDEMVRANPELLNAKDVRPAVTFARDVGMAERLLKLGADAKAAGAWWAAGFGSRQVAPEVARLLVERGAELTPHAAAGLGLTDRLAKMLAADPAVIDAKGGDDCTPLHFARDIATAQLLLRHGARVDARDGDHASTPAQWLIGDAPEVSRLLLEQGATPDVFLAAALGDRAMAEQQVQADPTCLAQWIGRGPKFPALGQGRGGSIYQWTLGFNSFAHQVALRKGHGALFDYLYASSDTATRFLVSCVLARRGEAEEIAAENPGLVAALPAVDLELMARYCWETNTNYEAVKLMLDLGFPVDHPERSHGYSALHNAAWAGSADLVDLLIARGAPVDVRDPGYNSTPLGYAIYDCTVEKRHPEGEFGRVAQSLLNAGCSWDALQYPVGDAQIDDVFRPRLREKIEGAALLGDKAALERMLGSAPDAKQLGLALAGAAKGGHAELCRQLLTAGAPVSDKFGRNQLTALGYAEASGSRETAALLREFGAE